jgi:hypothetical protein
LALLAGLAAFGLGAAARAQQPATPDQMPAQRVAEGRVVTRSEAPIPGAVVYLKDSKSLAVRTFIADADGRFHFGQLSQNADYELWANAAGERSKSKSISSFDSRNSYSFVLKIDTGK